MMMSFLCFVRRFVAMALLYSCQGADGGNETFLYPTDFAGLSVDGCSCYQQGKIYNLRPLERDDGEPRFNASDLGQWKYSYNPCRSFSQGPPQQSDCFGDVAICRWPKNKAHYQKIGKQTTVYCGFNKEFLVPQLVYTNKESFPEWKVIVNLKCDPAKKTADEANFDYISAANNIWEFLVTSICSCPDGCPNDPEDSSAKTPADGVNKLEYVIPMGALAFLVIAVPLFIYRNRICHCARRENDQENEREPLNHGNDRAEYAANHFDEERGLENSGNVPRPSSTSPGLRSQISGANKHNKDHLNRGSNRHQNTEALA